MQCEICGAEIRGKSFRIAVDRAELDVCDKCKGFGKEVTPRGPVGVRRGGAGAPGAPVASPSRYPRRDVFDRIKDELVEDYAERIKKARDAKHMTDEQLAHQTQSKVNIIRKVERGELVPEDALIKKIEYVLDIKLTEGVAEPERGGRKGESRAMTLGDLIKVKRDHK
ncbi:MAG TPA: multiprotein bridging factor aMBF1 [Methanocella sp.]|nr:multiprotein bridging factor aMBF1 [Methanocella sp.]